MFQAFSGPASLLPKSAASPPGPSRHGRPATNPQRQSHPYVSDRPKRAAEVNCTACSRLRSSRWCLRVVIAFCGSNADGRARLVALVNLLQRREVAMARLVDDARPELLPLLVLGVVADDVRVGRGGRLHLRRGEVGLAAAVYAPPGQAVRDALRSAAAKLPKLPGTRVAGRHSALTDEAGQGVQRVAWQPQAPAYMQRAIRSTCWKKHADTGTKLLDAQDVDRFQQAAT